MPEPDAEVHVRRGQPELAEEHVGHALVVVLARVDDALRARRARSARMTGAALMKFGRAPMTWARWSGMAVSMAEEPEGTGP